MKIAVVDFTGITKLPNMDKVKGCGASDRAVLELCRELPKLGNEVHFFAATTAQGEVDGATWHNVVEEGFECDVVIMQRIMIYQERFKYKKLIMWLHDDIDAPVNRNLDKILDIPDVFIVLSTYHKKRLMSLGVSESRIVIIPEGGPNRRIIIDKDCGPKCIYASAPFKGLPLLIKLWPRIVARVPSAELHICSGMGLYNAEEKNVFFSPLYDAMRKDPTIVNHGVLTNDSVLEVMAECSLMVYPNFYPETFCAAALEAISQGTPVITSQIGALPETVSDCGICVAGDPKSKEYQDRFVEIVVRALSSRGFLGNLQNCCRHREYMTWQDVVESINRICKRMIELV